MVTVPVFPTIFPTVFPAAAKHCYRLPRVSPIIREPLLGYFSFTVLEFFPTVAKWEFMA